MNYSIERENNIIKNIAKEIVVEGVSKGIETTQELADYLVKLKLLNPKHGFTASEVMPRHLTQQLVTMVVEDLKQETPAMNCIRMQVFWSFIKMNVADLREEYSNLISEKAEPYLFDIITLEEEDDFKMLKSVAPYVIVSHKIGNLSQVLHVKETVAAAHSVYKAKDITAFFKMSEEQKIESIKYLSRIVTGIRLYLIYLMNEEVEGCQVDLPDRLEELKKEIWQYNIKLTSKIDDIREVISIVVPMDYFEVDNFEKTFQNMPPDTDENDLRHLKKILVIMLQHRDYISDILSKLDEIDGDSTLYLMEFQRVLQKLHGTIRDREAVPTTEVYDDFEKLSEIWSAIQSYTYCLDCVENIFLALENLNKKEYFAPTVLEKAFTLTTRVPPTYSRSKKADPQKKSSRISKMASSMIVLKDSEDLTIEFNGFCAWTLYYNEGMLISGNPETGIFEHEDRYYIFSSKFAHDLWAKDPKFCLSGIYEYFRDNAELIGYLNVYDTLYSKKNIFLKKKDTRRSTIRSAVTQTAVHPVKENWVKDYTFSIWELKKRALALSRIVKCQTKSVQTESPHSHFRASIGLLAAPDKDKEVQTKRDSYCNHSPVSNYLYGLRGQLEDKFSVIELTRPIDESFQKQINLEEEDPCRERQRKKMQQPQHRPFYPEPCPSLTSDSKCDYSDDSTDYLFYTYNPEQ